MAHVLYGMRGADVGETALLISEALGSDLQERESDYFGIYRSIATAGVQIKVVSRIDPEGEPLEDGLDEYQTLVYVQGESVLSQFGSLVSPGGPLDKLRD